MIDTQDPAEAAAEAGLRYILDDRPGITRRKSGRGYSYRRPNGDLIRDNRTRKRINALAIPPAWSDVWICPSPNGHLQATGRDAKGRKQYRYHDDWSKARDETKYEHMVAFGQALPALREQVDADMRKRGLPREKVLAAIVRLLETTLIRVGNDQYAKDNKSYGLTTMWSRHADVEGNTITFSFLGKAGIEHEIDLKDRRLATIVAQCQDLPGQRLFQYIDEDGNRQNIDSGDVNDYLREITGDNFTAKDFRTWAGTILAAEALAAFETFDSEAAAKKNVVAAIETVAGRLGNTPSVCRACYVHPAVLDAYMEGQTVSTLEQRAGQEIDKSLLALPDLEARVLSLLHAKLASGDRMPSETAMATKAS